MGLAAHVNTRRVEENEVTAVVEPEFTKTWHPVSHLKVINKLGSAVKETGLEIVKREYSLSSNGMNMFGVWTLSQSSDGSAWAVGLRNSMSKAFAVGVCAGLSIFVCDNLAFAGDFVEFRKHTSGLTEEVLKAIATNAMEKVTKRLEAFSEWHKSLNSFPVEKASFKALTFDAMVNGVFPESKFSEFLGCWKKENKLAVNTDFVPESLYTFHAAGTRLMRDASLFNVSKRNDALISVIDKKIEKLKSTQKESRGFIQTLKEKFDGITGF